MNRTQRLLAASLSCVIVFAFGGCKSDQKPGSLGDIDKAEGQPEKGQLFIKKRSPAEIKKAYEQYLRDTDSNDKFRINALSRLAELELRASQTSESSEKSEEAYERQLDKTIELLTRSVTDYPKAKNNDVLLYQLAKAYAQKGDNQRSIDRLEQLTQQYPNSSFYAEAEFRIGENAFSQKEYSKAEQAYTEVIVSPGNDVFYEKALFKRGWSRFKEQFYADAIDDFIDSVNTHGFDSYDKLNKSELEQFDEYLRGIGLAFSYLGGAEAVHGYFSEKPGFKYIYNVYATLAGIYRKQERYSDAVAAFQAFVKDYPKSERIPYSRLEIIKLWQESGFGEKVRDAVGSFYAEYNPGSKYWVTHNKETDVSRTIRRSLKEYVVLMAGYYHSEYQKSSKAVDFDNAKLWYTRYLEFYSTYAQTDNIYFRYAELLAQKGQYKPALEFYEKAAYQDGMIVNKDAAYGAVFVADKLFSQYADQKQYLEKLISYALKYAQAYPEDKRTESLMVRAIELAFGAKEYKSTIELADSFLAKKHAETSIVYVSGIKAEAYFDVKEFAEAESIYREILNNPLSSNALRGTITNKLALAIYEQGNVAKVSNDVPRAIKHYSRISDIAPTSEIAATGLYDAIALDMQHEQWSDAISLIQRFQRLYPNNQLRVDVAKKLSVAYLNSKDEIKAAKEFEKLASIDDNVTVRAAALWKAAELYASKDKNTEAVRAYEDYAKKFKKPFPQYMEAMHRLSELYNKVGSPEGAMKWQNNIVDEDLLALNNVKTDRTKLIVSNAYLRLADKQKVSFDKTRLTVPLKVSLKQKKNYMENAVKLYAKAAKYKIFDAVTESTYQIATIYEEFSKSLLASDRPKNLNPEELNQYEILLEDQAFPFEDKAIEFYEINLGRIKEGGYNDWIRKSQEQLIKIFPARYNREPKQDVYVSFVY